MIGRVGKDDWEGWERRVGGMGKMNIAGYETKPFEWNDQEM